jgi:hypothetical protein
LVHGLALDGVLILRKRAQAGAASAVTSSAMGSSSDGSRGGGGFGGFGGGLFDDDFAFDGGRSGGGGNSGGNSGGGGVAATAGAGTAAPSLPGLGALLDALGCRPVACGPPLSRPCPDGGAAELFVFLAPGGLASLAALDGWDNGWEAE